MPVIHSASSAAEGEWPFVVEAGWDYLMNSTGWPRFWISTLGTFIIHELAYFGNYIPWLIIDAIPFFRRWKIQPNKVNDRKQQWACFRHLMFSHFCIQLPMMLLTHPILEALGMSMELPLPSWRTLAWQIPVFFVVEDFYFYWIHRLLHHGAWYKYIHKIHHEYAAPFGIAAEYAHPVETAFLGLGSILGPFLFARHLFTLWVWLVIRLAQTIECHAGYDLPWSPSRWLPGWGGADFHDYHHMAFKGNYASTFRVWDWVFGTDVKYRKWKAEGAPTGAEAAAAMKAAAEKEE